MSRAILVVIVTWCSAALAQSSARRADTAFQKGRELMAAGKIAEACDAFEDSQKAEPAVTTLLNLAGCREKLGQLATAWRLFGEAERQTRTATDDTNRQLHDIARARTQKLEPRLSKLTIRVPPQSRLAGLEITLDTQRVEGRDWNQPQPVDGGAHTITARAPGAERWTQEVRVAPEGDSRVAEIQRLTPARSAAAVAAAAAPSEPSSPDARGSRLLLPLVVGAGGAAFLVAGLGFELSAESKYDAAKAEKTNQARRSSLEDTANTRRYVAQGLAAAGLCAGGAAVWIYLRGRADDHERATSTAIRVVPNGAGLAVTGRF